MSFYFPSAKYRRRNPRNILSPVLGGENSAEFAGSIDAGWSLQQGVGNLAFNLDVENSSNGFYIEDDRLKVIFAPTDDIDPGTSGSTPGKGAPRVERSMIGITDFDVYVKHDFDPLLVESDIAGTGFYLEQSGGNSARMDAFVPRKVRQVRGYAQFASNVVTLNEPIQVPGKLERLGWPCHQRLRRVGDVYTWFVSFDGYDWFEMFSETWSGELSKLGVTYYVLNDATPPLAPLIMQTDYIHFDTGDVNNPDGKYTLNLLNISRNTLLTDDFSNLDNWRNDSINGGSVTVANNQMALFCDTPDYSVARVISNLTLPRDCGMVFKARNDVSLQNSSVFLGAVLQGLPFLGQDWADPYVSPIAKFVFEGNNSNTDVRLLANSGKWKTRD